MADYWASLTTRRIRRRQALAVTTAGAAGALLLAACGGGSDKQNYRPELRAGDTADGHHEQGEARRHLAGLAYVGCAVVRSALHEYPELAPEYDDVQPALQAGGRSSQARATGSVVGDAVESYEFSPDKLQMTMKLRPNKWHSIAPVNGRAVDAEDIAFTFQRLSAVGTNRAFYAGSLGGPIDSVTATDSKTVVMKLNQVYAPLLAVFSTNANGNFYIVPRESENQSALDLRRTMVGSGPWALKEYRPSAGYTFRRHEGWYAADKLYVDETADANRHRVRDGPGAVQAGRIYRYAVRGKDIVPTKNDNVSSRFTWERSPMDTGLASTAGTRRWVPRRRSATNACGRRCRCPGTATLWLNAFFGVESCGRRDFAVESRWATACNCGWKAGGWTPRARSSARTPSTTSTTSRKPRSWSPRPASQRPRRRGLPHNHERIRHRLHEVRRDLRATSPPRPGSA